MTTYTIKPIAWREQNAYLREDRIGQIEDGSILQYRASLPLDKYCPVVEVSTLDEAKSFIETSYREFVEQFLEKI